MNLSIPGSQPSSRKGVKLLLDDKPLLKEWWFVNQPFKNASWTSRLLHYLAACEIERNPHWKFKQVEFQDF